MKALASMESLRSIMLVFILATVGLSGCTKGKSSEEYLSDAQREFEQGNLKTAVIQLKNALQDDADNGAARLLFGKILNKVGKGVEAEAELKKAKKQGVDETAVKLELARAYLLQGQFKRILDQIEVTYDDLGPLAASLHEVRGNAYFASKDFDKAKMEFNYSLKKDENFVGGYLGLAQLAAVGNDLNEAFELNELALSKDPVSTKALLLKGHLHRVQGALEQAREAYNKVVSIDKANMHGWIGLATSYLAEGDYGAAKKQLDAAQEISPDAVLIQFLQGLIQFQKSEYKTAKDTIQLVLKQVPGYPPAVRLHGAIAWRLGNYESALDILERFSGRFPEDAYARQLLADTLIKLGDYSKALVTLQPLLASKKASVSVLVLAAEAEQKAKNYSNATRYLERAVEANPDVDLLKNELAFSRYVGGDADKAVDELDALSRKTKVPSKASFLRVVILLREREYNRVLEVVADMEKNNGINPVSLNLKSSALLGKRDFVAARKVLEKLLVLEPSNFSGAARLSQMDWQEGKKAAAKKRFEELLRHDGNSTQAMISLAGLAKKENNPEEFLGWIEKAIKTRPDLLLPRVHLTKYYLSVNNQEKALETARSVVTEYPESPEGLGLLGETLLNTGNHKAALDTYSKLVERTPGFPSSIVQLGLAQVAAKEIEGARISFKKALTIQPDFEAALDNLIKLEIENGYVDAALKMAVWVQHKKPRSAIGYEREASILIYQKQYADAAKAYQKALDNGSGSKSVVGLHKSLLASDGNDLADKMLKRFLVSNGDAPALLNYSAAYYMRNFRNKEAVLYYEKLLDITPKNARAMNNLANLYQDTDMKKAFSYAESAYAIAPSNPVIQDTLGWILVEKGMIEKGVELIRSALSGAQNSGSIRYHLALALERMDKIDDAKIELQLALESGQQFPENDEARLLLDKWNSVQN
ncbi:MAG: XrtA/PEP-CTERM system TPR-repeat protein PrsT [Motiliproteus sp.]